MSDPTRIGDVVDVSDTKALVDRMSKLPRRRLQAIPSHQPDPNEARERRWKKMVGPRLAQAHVDDLDGQLSGWVQQWLDSDTADLVLLGPVGTGKTWAATAAARARYEQGAAVEWTTAPQLWHDLRPDGDSRGRMRAVQTADVLVLDDVGRDKPSDWTLEQLHLVLDHRDRHMLPTVVTSNFAVSPSKTNEPKLADRIGRQAASRLLGGDTVGGEVAGDDRRMT